MKWIVRVNTRTGEIAKAGSFRGGDALGRKAPDLKIPLREVPPTCDPLGRHNKLIIAPGLLGDTMVTTTGKFSVGGKSPLTHGVKESDVGGEAGKKIARLGIKAIVLEDLPDKPATRILSIKASEAHPLEFPELKGKRVTETFQALRKQFGPQAGSICIGPAGEMKMAGAGVAVTDAQDIQVRYAARGDWRGHGVQGNQGHRCGRHRCRSPFAFSTRPFFGRRAKPLCRAILADPKTENRHHYGTPAVLMACNELGILPTRNFSAGQFEKAEELSGERIAEMIEERGGEGRSGTPVRERLCDLLFQCLSRPFGKEDGCLDPVREHRPSRTELRDRQRR